MDYVFSQKPSDNSFWLRAYDAKYRSKGAPLIREDWDEVFGDCDAVSDFPCAAFSEELIAAYPEAKVILTVRDSMSSWFDSCLRTVWFVHRQSPFARGKFLGRPVFDILLSDLFRMGKRMFGDVFDGDLPRTGVQVYEWHDGLIRRIVPKERLLVFNVKEGWTPLCDFLGIEVTQEMKERGFPHVNEGQAFVDKVLGKQAVMRRKIREIGVAVVVGLLVLIVLLVRLW